MIATDMPFYMKSFSTDAWYRVGRDTRTCDCAHFRMMPGPPCKHLRSIGIHSERRPFVPSERPTFSQALSALVKSLRLRRASDAVYWLVYLDTFPERTARMRMARRLLIGSAEDGHSIAIMETVASNFPELTRRRTDLLYLAAEALRICKLPNWWHPTSRGKDYIYSGLLAERALLHYPGHHTKENMIELIEHGISGQDRVAAIAGVMGLSHARMSSTAQAELLARMAAGSKHKLAQRLVQIHLRAKSAMSGDNNFLCEAAWMMAGGYSPVAELSEPVFVTEALEALENARERWKAPQPIPRWCCDGLHSAGDDERFMGVWFHMYAACLAFERYGRLDPQDKWLPEFYCYDGLTIALEPPPQSTSVPYSAGNSDCAPIQQTTHSVALSDSPHRQTNDLHEANQNHNPA